MSTNRVVCTRCRSVDFSKTVTPGSIGIEILLWLCFLFPGLIYSVWRLASRHNACGRCGAKEIIPVDSPEGERLRSSSGISHDSSVNYQNTSYKPSTKKSSRTAWIIGIATILFFWLGSTCYSILTDKPRNHNTTPIAQKDNAPQARAVTMPKVSIREDYGNVTVKTYAVAESALTVLMSECVALNNNVVAGADSVVVTVVRDDTMPSSYRKSTYGWNVYLLVEVFMKKYPVKNVNPDIEGHTLWYYLGGATHPGVVSNKAVGHVLCDMDGSTSDDQYRRIPAMKIVDRLK